MNKTRGHGFSILELILLFAVVGIIGALVWVFFINKSPETTPTTGTDSSGKELSYIEWSFDGNSWKPADSVPACADPLTIKLPADAKKVSNVLYPGQIRGGDFKPHGGLGVENPKNNGLVVTTPMDAFLYRGSRYIQDGEVQYMFDFIHPCGIMYRLDHLKTLSEEFNGYAGQLPEPKADSSQTEKFVHHPLIKQRAVVASEVGLTSGPNVFFDFGIYDLRKQNEASKTDTYKVSQLRIDDKEQSFFAVCWLNLLEGEEKSTITSLPARGIEGKISDYCK